MYDTKKSLDQKNMSSQGRLNESSGNNMYNPSQSAQKNKSHESSVRRADAHDYERKIQDLCEANEILDHKLNKTSDQKAKLLQKLKETEDDNEKYQDQISKMTNFEMKQAEEIASLKDKISELTLSNKNLNEKCKTKFEILNKELEEKDNAVDRLSNTIKAKDETIKYFSVNNDQSIRNQNIYKDELDFSKREKGLLEQKVRDLERKLDEMYINRKSEAGLMLEIDHLKDDNIRLLGMLKSTEEYRDFAYLAEDCSGGIRYINPDKFKAKGGLLKNCEEKARKDKDPLNDENWVPISAYHCAYEFRNRYNVELSETLINELLSALNKIWRDREQKYLARMKTKYTSEIMTLRRKAAMKSGYDEFSAMKTISKLKKDLKNTREDANKYMLERNKLKSTPSGIDLVDNALKVANNFTKTKVKLESEIKTLKKQINEKDDKTFKENFERLKFNEGAFWIVSRCVSELEEMNSRIQECVQDFQNRCRTIDFDNEFNLKIVTNAKTWFIQTLDSIVNETLDKVRDWQYSTQKNIDNLS